MKIEPKFYRVRVSEGSLAAGLICITSNFDAGKQFVGIEYYALVWSFDDTVFSIPSSRQATFQEELRVLHHAISTYEGKRVDETKHIETKLKEAYGSAVTVTFEEIQAIPSLAK
ncbi:MAG: hypothetical protein OEW15_07395 [Nitrospirota bacterium]|nr:hypothetical protein [Nitrospirota bacterium]